MNLDLDTLSPVLVAYDNHADSVTARETVDGYWLRIGSEEYQKATDSLTLSNIKPSEVNQLLEPFQTIEIGQTTLVNHHPTTTPGRWEGLQLAADNDRQKAAEIFSDLFDESLSIDERLGPFGDYFRTEIQRIGEKQHNVPQKISKSPVYGLSTALLELLYPESYTAYKYGISAQFFKQYFEYTVNTAGQTDIGKQYGTLLEGWRSVRDELRRLDSEADMLDVHAITWNLDDLDELAPEEVVLPSPEPTLDPPERANELEESLRANKQIILYGPPGTGKTYTASRFADWWINQLETTQSGTSQTVTFHPSISYEDFVEGFSPSDVDTTGPGFELTDGIFKQMAADARTDYEKTPNDTPPRHVLIIDELNRGEVATVFGELVTALEAEKRLDESTETTVTLSHSGEPFTVPPNLYVIGTMNTADRSISLIDTAIRRRFRFLYFPPRFDLVRQEYADEENDLPSAIRESADALETINSRLREDLSRGKQIGHAYLFGVDNLDDLRQVWRYELLPLLEEYYFDQFDRLRQQIFNGRGDELFDWENQRIRSFDIEELQSALTTLR